MTARMTRRAAIAAAALAMVGSIGSAGAAVASDFSVQFPAGTACAFPLRVDGTGGHRIEHTFTDKDGTMRVLSTGTGSALTFTNESTGATVSLRSNGAVQRTTSLADGSSLNVLTGHNVLFLFPTDVPAGPSTTLHTGQVVFNATPSGDFTVLATQGTSRDLCAELTG
ncbi:MAG TPA: hypothetical protein VLA55_10260 [Ornithinibacter sp.]|nr:hypothetical protein [Ornithinibacter sp.]